MIVIELLINISYFILALMLPEKICKTNKEISRKMAHILCGNWIFIYAYFNIFHVTNVIVLIFMIILMCLSYKYNIFKGVERDGQKKSFGTVYFFVAYIVFVMYIAICNLNREIYLIYILPLVYGDAFAAIVGKKLHWIEYTMFNNTKSVSGNIAMMLVSFLIISLYNTFFLNNCYSTLYLLLTSIVASVIEAISIKGTDNLTIPLFTMMIMEIIL